MLVFEKHMEPTNLDEKYKLKIIANYCLNEEVKSACFGHLRISEPKAIAQQAKEIKREHYCPNTTKSLPDADTPMRDDSPIQVDDKLEASIKQDINVAKTVLKKCLEVVDQHEGQLMYGTAEGSIGTIFRVPPVVFFVLNALQSTMDKMLAHDLMMVKRSEFRTCHHTLLQFEPVCATTQGILDGDWLE